LFFFLILILNLESNPLFASLLPDVIRCFSLYFDIDLIGVKQRPPITMAFSYLMEKRNQLLNIKTASKYFSYLNKLDGINKHFILNISNIQFIPLSGLSFYYCLNPTCFYHIWEKKFFLDYNILVRRIIDELLNT